MPEEPSTEDVEVVEEGMGSETDKPLGTTNGHDKLT